MKNFKLYCASILGLIVTVSVFVEYMANHTYYYDMMNAPANWRLLIVAVIAWSLPVAYKYFVPKSSLIWWLASWTIWLVIFWRSTVGIKDSFVGAWWPLKLLAILLIFSAMIWWFLTILTVLWSRLYSRRRSIDTIHDVLTWAWLWLSIFVIFNLILIYFNVFYPVVTRAQVIAAIVAVVYKSWLRKQIAKILESTLDHIDTPILRWLLIITCAYMFYSVIQWFIPYSTARDANHMYMYVPKVWAENHWYMWDAQFWWLPMFAWLSYVSFFFSLFQPFKLLRVWPDSVAVLMNMISSWMTLVMILALAHRWYQRLRSHHDVWWFDIPLAVSWFIALLRLTSGMGAFLVFVDNKSDFWVLTFSLLGLYIGIQWLHKHHGYDWESSNTWTMNYFLLSGLFYGIAILSKPTALFDAFNFVVLALGTRFGSYVAVWLVVALIGIIAVLQIQSIVSYIPKSFGIPIAIVWWVMTAITAWLHKSIKNLFMVRYLVWRWAVIVVILTVFKLPLLINNSMILQKEYTVWEYIKWIVIWQATTATKNAASSINASSQYAATTIPAQQCTLASQRISKAQLYDGLKPALPWNEDLGRYMWYGQKEFKDPIRKFLFPQWCISWISDAKYLCNNPETINLPLATLFERESEFSLWIPRILSWARLRLSAWIATGIVQIETQRALNQYRKDNVIVRLNDTVAIPYKYLVPLNVTHNRSLQNLSSYYTDIWITWLFCMIILLLACISSITERQYILVTILLTTIWWWIVWILVWSAIVRYGISMITWTIFALSLRRSSTNIYSYTRKTVMLVLLVVSGMIQLVLNFVRISSQVWSGAFAQYRYWNGIERTVWPDLQQIDVINNFYTASNIFDLQFPHYNKFLRLTKDIPDAIMIGWTYLPYFVVPQIRLHNDWFLSRLQELLSDGNSCRAYLRLKDIWYKYIVADPNIATVVMWEWNQSLFDRFFGKLSGDVILWEGAMTMLAQMIDDGYISLVYSNNIWAMYGFGLSASEIQKAFGVPPEKVKLIRAKLPLARFFPDGNDLLNKVWNVLRDRIIAWDAVWDIADIIWKDIDTAGMTQSIKQYISTKDPSSITKILPTLNADQRLVLANYLWLLDTSQKDTEKFNSQIVSFMNLSINGSSQLIVLEVR